MEHDIAAAVRRVQGSRQVCAPAPTTRRRAVVQAKLACLIAEALNLLSESPHLIKPFLAEFKEITDGRTPPNMAHVKAAMNTVLEQVADRWDELEEDPDLCSVDESDTEPLDQWQPTRAEVEFVKRRFFPALFAPRPRPKESTTTAPASPDRIAIMAARVEAGEDLYHPEDATAEGRKLRVAQRMNGAKDMLGDSLQVLGWAE